MRPARGTAPAPAPGTPAPGTSPPRQAEPQTEATEPQPSPWKPQPPLHPALCDITGPPREGGDGRWRCPVSLCPGMRGGVGSALERMQRPRTAGAGPHPDATGSEQREGQGATGTQGPRGRCRPFRPCRDQHGLRQEGGTVAEVLSPRPRGRAGLSAQSCGPQSCGPLGSPVVWSGRAGRSHGPLPQVNRGGEGSLPSRPPTSRPSQNPTQRPASRPEHPPLPVPGPSAQASAWPRTLAPGRQRLRFLAKPPPGTRQPEALFGEQTATVT